MAGVNKVILVGNLGADPEARSLNNGSEVVNMRIATSESWKDKEGQRQERTEWHNVVYLQRELGRVDKSYLRKAQGLTSKEGIPAMDRPTGKDRLYTEIVLQRFRGELFCSTHAVKAAVRGAASAGDDMAAQAESAAAAPRPQQTSATAAVDSDIDDDVPF